MKFRFVFILILLILLTISVFVGLPYIIRLIKSGAISFSLPFTLPFSLPTLPLPKVTTGPVSNYFFTLPAPIQSGQQVNQAQTARVKIGSVYHSSNQQQISLTSSYGAVVNITGWKIKSANRGETIIGKGINLPQLDVVLSDIWLKGGNSVDIIVGRSPLVANFQINGCFGWLNALYNLDYSASYCSDGFNFNDLKGLDSICQDLILSSGSCRTPSDNVLNKNYYSYQCRQWAEKNMNYSACVTRRVGDSNFYKGWKIYTGNSNLIFDPRHDKIELRDQNGVFIDSYEY